jgi:hypothetical protein
MSAIRISLIISTALIAAGCASSSQQSAATQSLPDWVTAPYLEDGFADTQCVLNSGSMGILKNKATALGRAEITKQIDVQVKAMDKTYENLTEAEGGAVTGTTYESVSKQVASQTLSGSRATKVEYVDFPDGTQQLCVMVTLDPKLTKELYGEITGKSGRKLSAQDDAVLWQEFKAHKAQEELDADLSKRNQ